MRSRKKRIKNKENPVQVTAVEDGGSILLGTPEKITECLSDFSSERRDAGVFIHRSHPHWLEVAPMI